MNSIKNAEALREKELMKEIADMKFSFKKLRKIIELDALISYYYK